MFQTVFLFTIMLLFIMYFIQINAALLSIRYLFYLTNQK